MTGTRSPRTKYLLWVSEVVYEFDFLHQIPSNVSDLLAQVVLCEGVICRQPEAHIFIAGWVPAQTDTGGSLHRVTRCLVCIVFHFLDGCLIGCQLCLTNALTCLGLLKNLKRGIPGSDWVCPLPTIDKVVGDELYDSTVL